MKIAWLLNNINQVGGIEQVVCGLSSHMVEALGYEVTIISLNTSGGMPYFPLASGVAVRHCGLDWRDQTRTSMDQAIASVMETLDADLLLTCHSYISIGALRHRRRFRGKIIVTQHCANGFESWKRRLMNACYYRFADALVVLSKQDQKEYRYLGCRSVVIPNAVYGKIGPRASLEERVLLAVGRLTAVKGFDMLLQAFSMVAEKHRDWKLCICGDGEDAGKLKELAASLGLQDRVEFPGFVDVSAYMSRAGGFVVSSRSEGFSLVLVEAMAHGLPVVGYALPPVKEITVEQNALLVPVGDVAALAEKIDCLLGSEALRLELGERSYSGARRYAVDAVAQQWTKLFAQVLSGRGA